MTTNWIKHIESVRGDNEIHDWLVAVWCGTVIAAYPGSSPAENGERAWKNWSHARDVLCVVLGGFDSRGGAFIDLSYFGFADWNQSSSSARVGLCRDVWYEVEVKKCTSYHMQARYTRYAAGTEFMPKIFFSRCTSLHCCKENNRNNFFHSFVTLIKPDIWNIESLYKPISKNLSLLKNL